MKQCGPVAKKGDKGRPYYRNVYLNLLYIVTLLKAVLARLCSRKKQKELREKLLDVKTKTFHTQVDRFTGFYARFTHTVTNTMDVDVKSAATVK